MFQAVLDAFHGLWTLFRLDAFNGFTPTLPGKTFVRRKVSEGLGDHSLSLSDRWLIIHRHGTRPVSDLPQFRYVNAHTETCMTCSLRQT